MTESKADSLRQASLPDEDTFAKTSSTTSTVLRHSKYKLGDKFNNKVLSLVRDIDWPKTSNKQGRVVQLGVVNNNGVTTVSDMGSKAALLIDVVNKEVAKYFAKRNFHWDTMRVEVGCRYSGQLLAEDADSQQIALVLKLGPSSCSKGFLSSDAVGLGPLPGAAFFSGLKEVSSKSGEPGENHVVIKLYRSRYATDLDAYDRNILTKLGFHLVPDKKYDLGLSCAGKKLGDKEYVMIHCCSEQGNLLSRP